MANSILQRSHDWKWSSAQIGAHLNTSDGVSSKQQTGRSSQVTIKLYMSVSLQVFGLTAEFES